MADQFFGRDSAQVPPPGWQAPTLSEPDLRGWVWVVHILHALTFVTGITGLAAVIVAYIRRPDARGTIYESHLTYAIRSFWIGIILTAIATVLCFVLIGFVMFMFVGVWWLVRVIRPFIAMADNRPIAQPEAFF